MGNAIYLLPCLTKIPPEEQRELIANDEEYNAAFQYTDNSIKTSYYTWWNFIVLNLFEQFHRVVNIYFIVILILTCIPVLSSLSAVTTILPIIFVLGITAIKDGYDDVYRHKSDNFINNRLIKVVKERKLIEVHWKDVQVGNIVLVKNNDHIAADMLLLSTSDDNNQVYIETAELDGETNLKVRQPLPVTREMKDDVPALSKFKGKLTCEKPNNRLDKFSGNLEVEGEKYGLDNDKILLRGCAMRNTSWCYGLVIFAGHQTKLMQNTGRRYMKRTSIEKLMNRLVWWIFLTLVVLSTISAILNGVWEGSTGNNFQIYLPWEPEAPNPAMAGFLVFWSFLILLNTLVPISLYVSVEMIRLMQSLLIDWDEKLYYDKKDLPAVARTTTLNEELGQVEYIFSDKTGTLTQNVMSFKKCCVDGIRYGDVPPHMVQAVEDDTADVVDLSFNRFAEPSFRFYDASLIDAIVKEKKEKCQLFFRAIALCHTSLIEKGKDGSITYRAQSPDEGALVSAARNFGFVFTRKTYDTITVEALGKETTYKIHAVLEFNSDRKRMSIILQDPDDGKIMLFCKGADSMIIERLKKTPESKAEVEKTQENLDNFANSGLRTLCVAMKEIDPEDFKVWNKAFEKANTAIEDKEDQLYAVYEEIERDLELLGATAIEDKLQDGVPETIEKLKNADIKIWVLTGDKQETAINIGYSCNMLKETMHKMIIKGHTAEEVKDEIDKFLKSSQNQPQQNELNGAVNLAFDHSNGMRQSSFSSAAARSTTSTSSSKATDYGLIVNGHSLIHALEDHREDFLQLATRCSAVICCRATPLQKAKVVELIKKNKGAVTLAIGDGANDVSMIKAAHIGVGISGEEGTQAVLSSDFAFGQFRYLERLLLVHGKWSYTRICKFLGYFFYKNFAFTLVHFWFAIYSGFSAQSVYDDWFVTLYNTIYTALPIILLGVLEQDHDDKICLKVPKLYSPGQLNEFFNYKLLIVSLLQGVYTSLCTFFLAYGCFSYGQAWDGRDITDLQTFGTVVETSVITVVTLQVALETSFWTALNHYFYWGSLILFFIGTLMLTSNGLFMLLPNSFPFYGSTTRSYAQPLVWIVIVLTVVASLMPILVMKYVRKILFPSKSEKELKKYMDTMHSQEDTALLPYRSRSAGTAATPTAESVKYDNSPL